ncbi:hypothetical protein Syun_031067 [Stephania yunnanensis]|uniref:Uncharacterized protein n=1 Tax=Stephania yunnanensis TaxID=152371 RepID=A0AAP0DVL8_9MAGN
MDEIFEVIHFVDRKISSSSFQNKKAMLAEALWENRNFCGVLLPKIIRIHGKDAFQALSELDKAISIIRHLKEVLRTDSVQKELAMITDFLLVRGYQSTGELYGYIEQIYIDMLNEYLIQLPNAIFKEIIESHAEEYEEKVKFALKVLCKMEQLEDLVHCSVVFESSTGSTHNTFQSVEAFADNSILTATRDEKEMASLSIFSLNSVTLTLLSIAVKLPVDLTSPMPGVQDQLSKLTGTALICNSMGFFMPSLGMNTNSECFTNMIALSILAVTVVVNICIQLHTGVIFLFRVQHILILCSMIILLMTLWFCSLYVHNEKEASTDGIKDCLTNGRKSMFYRLQMCYLYSYSSDPQFHMIYKTVFNVFVSMICTLCSVLLIRSAVSLVPEDLKPCAYGVSDYKWSMSIIVVSQLVTLIVAGLGVFLRFFTWFILLPSRDFKAYQEEVKDADYVILRNPILRSGIQDSCVTVTKIVMNFIIKLIPFLVMFPYAVVLSLTDECFKKKVRHEEDIEKFKDLLQNEKRGLDKWTFAKE